MHKDEENRAKEAKAAKEAKCGPAAYGGGGDTADAMATPPWATGARGRLWHHKQQKSRYCYPLGERARVCARVGDPPTQAGGPGKEDAAPAEPTHDVELVMAMQPHLLAQPGRSRTVVWLAP